MLSRFFSSFGGSDWTVSFVHGENVVVRVITNDVITILIWMGSYSKGRPPSQGWAVNAANQKNNISFNIDRHTYTDSGEFSNVFYDFINSTISKTYAKNAKFSATDLRDGKQLSMQPAEQLGLFELVELSEKKAIRPPNFFDLLYDVFNGAGIYRAPY